MLCKLKLDDEAGRVRALQRYGILDSEEDHNFDAITALVKDVLGAPIAAVTLVDEHQQWFKSVDGFNVRQSPRSVSFCDHTLRAGQPMLIEDARLDRLGDVVVGPALQAHHDVDGIAAGRQQDER